MGALRTAHVAPAELLERSRHLVALRDARAAVGSGGVLVLLSGEAGGGKTTLVRRFCNETRSLRVWWGACDPLFTPRPLGPFIDIVQDFVQDVAGTLRDLVDAGAKPYQIAAEIVRDVQANPGTVIVLEDLHWADAATLDVVSLLGRRMETIPALLIVTYRHDELGRTHPLRRLLGELRGAATIRRLTAEPLSVDAVRVLAGPYGLDPAALHHATAGNPFFVTEVLAARSDDIPVTVRDAVLARTARLTDAATRVVEAVSIAVPQAELWLLDELVHDSADGLDECLTAGILEGAPGGIGFRHELARITIEESLSPHRRIALHRSALQALAAPPGGIADLARLAHHADAAGDTAAVTRYAPAAARYAASIGSHREAAAQYARALRFGAALRPDDRAALFEGRSYECYLADDMDNAVDALLEAIDQRRTAGNQLAEATAMSMLSRRLYCGGRPVEAAKIGLEAVHMLEALPTGAELALAYGNLGSLAMDDDRAEEAIDWLRKALAIAEPLGDVETMAHSLDSIGTVRLLNGDPGGLTDVERSLALAEGAGMEEHIGRVYINIGWSMTRTRAYAQADWLDVGAKRCADLGLELWKLYVLAYRARMRLDRGAWDDAAEDAAAVLRSGTTVPLVRILALTVLGLVRARRGDPEQWLLLDEALTLADGQDDLQYLVPVATARAEAAWLDGRSAMVDPETSDVLETAATRNAAWVVGELAWLRRLAGIGETVEATMIDPYQSQLAGDPRAAAARWMELGCPYDSALALVDSDDETDLRTALAEFQRLGATAVATVVARRLRGLGVRGLPRGPRPATKNNPASLTGREIEVLAFVRQGSSNAEIATRLFLSEKTVHHHISAILRKLGVASRGQAVAKAGSLGLPT